MGPLDLHRASLNPVLGLSLFLDLQVSLLSSSRTGQARFRASGLGNSVFVHVLEFSTMRQRRITRDPTRTGRGHKSPRWAPRDIVTEQAPSEPNAALAYPAEKLLLPLLSPERRCSACRSSSPRTRLGFPAGGSGPGDWVQVHRRFMCFVVYSFWMLRWLVLRRC